MTCKITDKPAACWLFCCYNVCKYGVRMVTLEQIKQFLDTSYGVTIPDFILQAAIDTVTAVQPCLDGAGYTASQMLMIQLYACAIIASAADPRKIKSQGAPNGASRSFEYGKKGIDAMRVKLRELDTSGCTTDIVGKSATNNSFFMVIGGGCA